MGTVSSISLSCRCGKVRGILKEANFFDSLRVVCHCKDCQKFAELLNSEKLTLDAYGGTGIIHTYKSRLKITKGRSEIRYLRLYKDGLFRWYAGCCNTSIGSIVSREFPLLALAEDFIHTKDMVRHFGPVRYYVNTKYAKKPPNVKKAYSSVPLMLTLSMMFRIVLWKVFNKQSGNTLFDNIG